MASIPEFLTQALQAQYGETLAAQILAGYACVRPVTLRVNTLKAVPEDIQAHLTQAGLAWEAVPWSPEALILPHCREDVLEALPMYQQGEIYLQSLSSMLPPLFLQPQPGENVLDMAAAPGGKTTQMAALSGGKAMITACEKNAIRAERLKFNIQRQGAGRVSVLVQDARKLDDFFSFDKILLDAPCSGSGTLAVAAYVSQQTGQGVTALSLRQPGGTLCAQVRRQEGRFVQASLGGPVKLESTVALQVQLPTPLAGEEI